MNTTNNEKYFYTVLEKDDSICYYCTSKAIYSEPEENTGNIIDVCNEHFRMKFGG
jgi:hypothetical protein